MANPEHVEVLKQGVEAWNKWLRKMRKDGQEFVPDLSGHVIKESDPDLLGWGLEMDLSGINLMWANLEGAYLGHVKFTGGRFYGANLRECFFYRCDFARSHLMRSDLRDATFYVCDLTEGELSSANLTGTKFAYTILRDIRVNDIQYSRRKMYRGYQGAIALETIQGHAIFRRDALDQDFIDTTRANWTTPYWNPRRFLFLWPWALFDYGRSWSRVLLLAVVLIGCFGTLYQYNDGYNIDLVIPDEVKHDSGDPRLQPTYPWFVAAIGFCTLGISDLVVPKTIWGQLLIFGNVAAGFLTLGLLLSVLGNVFARRAD